MSDAKESENKNPQPHKRRVHYSGKYPKKFEEKYKEQNPEKYGDTVAHVIEKGSTPAGMHISIMVQEILDFLRIQPGQRGLDATLGYGGHTTKMLEQLRGNGLLIGLDVDPIEIKKTEARIRAKGFGEDIFLPKLINFRNIDQVAAEYGPFDFILADLGVSSMQIDDPTRGFSYKIDGPLDLRMNPEKGESAADRLASITKEEFIGMMVENSDEPYAEEIAEEVFRRMAKGEKIDTTTALRSCIENAIEQAIQIQNQIRDTNHRAQVRNTSNKAQVKNAKLTRQQNRNQGDLKNESYKGKDNKRKQGESKVVAGQPQNAPANNSSTTNDIIDPKELTKKSCQRVFQALRIDVNSEMEVLYDFLDKLPDALAPGGRVAILTFHSGEDRLVKRAFKDGEKSGIYSEVARDVIRPSAEECRRNGRARSTKMRWAIRSL